MCHLERIRGETKRRGRSNKETERRRRDECGGMGDHEEEGRRERGREGGRRGLCLDMQPLWGEWQGCPKNFLLPLTSTEHVVKVEIDRLGGENFIQTNINLYHL